MGTKLDFELLSQCSMTPMCCRDVVWLWVHHWILSCCLNVQWCGHVLSRCGIRVMGTVLDFELLSHFNGVAMCCRDVVFVLWVRCWILSCCLTCSMVWPCVVRCDVNAMGTVLDFDTVVSCSMNMCCGHLDVNTWVHHWTLSCCLNVQ